MNEVFVHDKHPFVVHCFGGKGETILERREFLAAAGYVGVAAGGMAMGADAEQNGVTYFDLPGAPRLMMRRLGRKGGTPVLYIHGATFPSALSVGYRFADGKAWEHSLHHSGFDVWALDFEGFGGSARPKQFDLSSDCGSVPLQSSDAVKQIERAILFICQQTSRDKVSVIAHSWGGVCAARYASSAPKALGRLVLFAPPLTRPVALNTSSPSNRIEDHEPVAAWQLVTVAEQLTRFVKDTPAHHANVLAEPMLAQWGPTWLATDVKSGSRNPPAVKVPGGFAVDVDLLWSGVDVYDPASISAPTLLVRGEWDSACTHADAIYLQSRMKTNMLALATIPNSGHLAHLEASRPLLWAATNEFLLGATRK
jgi:pimeloyl-ACP methyl ester carboxylesterase